MLQLLRGANQRLAYLLDTWGDVHPIPPHAYNRRMVFVRWLFYANIAACVLYLLPIGSKQYTAIIQAASVISFLLIGRGYFLTARWFMWAALLFLLIFHYPYEAARHTINWSGQLIFFAFSLIPFFLFDVTERLALFSTAVLGIAAFFMYPWVVAWSSPLPPPWFQPLSGPYVANCLVSLILLLPGVFFLLRENNRAIRVNQQLRQVAEQRQEELIATQEQLVQSEKLTALGQLIAGIAHEINTPIGAIKSNAQQNLQELPILLQQLPIATLSWSVTHHQLFGYLLSATATDKPLLTTREERQLRQHAEDYLVARDVSNAPEVARLLLITGAYDGSADSQYRLQALWALPNATELLQLAAAFAQIHRSHANMLNAAAKTARIIEALRNYTQSGTAGERTSKDLHAQIETVLVLYENMIKNKITIARNYQLQTPVPVFEEIEQVWSNLIHNAILAMPQGGTLSIATRRENDKAIISFTDTGAGIAPAVQARLFEAFYTTRPKGQGTGLGLYICKRIVDKHGGTILAQSVPSQTSFSVSLPM